MISFTQTFDVEISVRELARHLIKDDVLELCERFGIDVAEHPGPVESDTQASGSVKELCDLAESMLGAWTEAESSDAHRLRMLLRDLRDGAL